MGAIHLAVAMSIFLTVLILSIHSHATKIRHEHRKVVRYRLFAVRDDLVRLVVEGHVSEDDEVFCFLYEGINKIIPGVKPATLRAVADALDRYMARSFDDTEFRTRFLAAVNHSDPVVRETAREFFLALSQILVSRSILIRAGLFLASRRLLRMIRARVGNLCDTMVNMLLSAMDCLFPSQYEANRIRKTTQLILESIH